MPRVLRGRSLAAILGILTVVFAVLAVVLTRGGGGPDRSRVLPAPTTSPDAGATGVAEGLVPAPPSAVDRSIPLTPIAPGQSAPAAAIADPSAVVIPAIGVNAKIVHLGLATDGTLQTPTDFATVGWYSDGPPPGAPGPSVLAGHVDNRSGPAVFYKLRSLVRNDVITVRRTDGSATAFSVTSVEQYPKAAFPTAKVYASDPRPVLRLVTCGGSFDAASGHYRDNIVVYAVATGS